MVDDGRDSKERHEWDQLVFCACHGHAFESEDTRQYLHVGRRSGPPSLGQICLESS